MWKWFGLALAGVLAMVACDDEPEPGQSGSGASSGTPSSATGMVTDCGDAAPAVLEANCRTCAESGCCAELAACDTDACVQRLQCEVSCADDATCIAGCASMHPEGDAASAVTSCLASSCDVCAAATTACGSDMSFGSPDCDSCIDANCCTELDACLLDADCTTCIESGEPDLCEMNAAYDATALCFDDNCLTPCSGG